jgi:Na+/H+ antiporter NhaC
MWIKELHIKPKTLKLIEEKVRTILEDMGTGEKFLSRTAHFLKSRFYLVLLVFNIVVAIDFCGCY